MARYGKEHKQATKRRIVEAAGRRLKRDGIDGSGIAALMADAGLTNGAFCAQPPGRDGLEQIVRAYLSVEHRDNPEDGCPSAALLDEIGRSTDATKRAYTDGLLVVIDDIAA